MICSNCGKEAQYRYIFPIDADLEKTWRLNKRMKNLFNVREGSICVHCGVNIRAQGLARAILQSEFGYGCKSLEEWVAAANKHKLKVCELNSCHELHHTLKKLKNYTFAEYGTSSQQDIEALTYKDKTFDLFLHSETIEHVSNLEKAMGESRRVLSDNGLILFSTPVIWSRKTKHRATIKKNKIVYLLPQSYHGKKTDDYLVFHEYGNDIDEILGINVAYEDWMHQNYIFACGKKTDKIAPGLKVKFRLQEKAALYLNGGKNE